MTVLAQLFTRVASQKWHNVIVGEELIVAEVYANALSDIFYYEHDDSSILVVKVLTEGPCTSSNEVHETAHSDSASEE
jgi:hypothetical protein